MQTELGQRFKTGGRSKGTPNKLTNEVRTILIHFLDSKIDEVMDLWSDLDNREKISMFLQLAKIILPKQIPDHIIDYEESLMHKIDFSHLTTEEIKELLGE
jgi:hypothetical protein